MSAGRKLGIGVLVAAATMAAAVATSGTGGAAAATPLRVREWHPAAAASTHARVAAGAPSVPMWSHTYTAGGTKYKGSMVGKNVFAALAHPSTTVPTQIVPIALTITDTGSVYDPSAPDPCLGGASAVSRTVESPIFTPRTYTLGGKKIGKTQFVDAFQRASFWAQTKPTGINPGYHVKLAVSVLPTMHFDISGSEVGTGCTRLGKVDIGALAATLLSHLADFSAAGVDSTKFPLLLLSNVVMYDSTPDQCCILGFHTAINNPYDGGVQTLAVAEYDSTNRFVGIHDVGIVTHEVGEWMDDPIGTNPTPSWGNIGQVSGCQGNLEVGDPLTGTEMKFKMPNGVVYHPQEMAFASWFFGLSPSGGVNGWYSMNGTFLAPAAPCTS
jgi:hypothetical protein